VTRALRLIVAVLCAALAVAAAVWLSGGEEPARSAAPQFRSQPALNPPKPRVRGRASAHVFLAPKSRRGQSGPMIVDATGRLVWFKALPRGIIPDDFKVQTYKGQPVLTWWEGRTNNTGWGQGTWVIADSGYREIARVKAGKGLEGDLHEFQLTEDGTALVTIYEEVPHDLTPIGSHADGEAVDGVIQEIDVETGEVVWEWRSLEHVRDIRDSHAGPPAPGNRFPYDYIHINSIDVDDDGNLLVSARNTWAVYKINKRTGRIMWTLGGKDSDFKLGRGAEFAWQHDARRMPDGTLTLFDNQSAPQQGDESRLLTLELDERRMRAKVVAEHTHPGPLPLLSDAEGNYQRLADGSHFAGWGIVGTQSELTPAGALRFDLQLPRGYDSYRAFAFEWDGRPADPPALAVERDGDAVTAYASWNGATGVTAWELLAGDDPRDLRVIATAPRTGFETRLQAETDAEYLAVRAKAGARALGVSDALVRSGG
jgi:hypothetical protein